jgi:hypothetical protein
MTSALVLTSLEPQLRSEHILASNVSLVFKTAADDTRFTSKEQLQLMDILLNPAPLGPHFVRMGNNSNQWKCFSRLTSEAKDLLGLINAQESGNNSLVDSFYGQGPLSTAFFGYLKNQMTAALLKKEVARFLGISAIINGVNALIEEAPADILTALLAKGITTVSETYEVFAGLCNKLLQDNNGAITQCSKRGLLPYVWMGVLCSAMQTELFVIQTQKYMDIIQNWVAQVIGNIAVVPPRSDVQIKRDSVNDGTIDTVRTTAGAGVVVLKKTVSRLRIIEEISISNVWSDFRIKFPVTKPMRTIVVNQPAIEIVPVMLDNETRALVVWVAGTSSNVVELQRQLVPYSFPALTDDIKDWPLVPYGNGIFLANVLPSPFPEQIVNVDNGIAPNISVILLPDATMNLVGNTKRLRIEESTSRKRGAESGEEPSAKRGQAVDLSQYQSMVDAEPQPQQEAPNIVPSSEPSRVSEILDEPVQFTPISVPTTPKTVTFSKADVKSHVTEIASLVNEQFEKSRREQALLAAETQKAIRSQLAFEQQLDKARNETQAISATANKYITRLQADLASTRSQLEGVNTARQYEVQYLQEFIKQHTQWTVDYDVKTRSELEAAVANVHAQAQSVLTRESAKLQEQINTAILERDQARSQVQSANTLILASNDAANRSVITIQALNEEIGMLKTTVAAFQTVEQSLTDQERLNAKLYAANDEALQTNQDLKTQVVSLEAQIEQMKTKLEQQSRQVESLSATGDERAQLLKKDLDKAHRDLEREQEATAQSASKLRKAQADLDLLQGQSLQATTTIGRLERAAGDHAEALAELQRKNSVKQQTLAAENNDLKQELAALKDKIRDDKVSSDSEMSSLRTLRREVQDHITRIKSLNDELTAAKLELKDSSSATSDLAQRHQELTTQYKSLQRSAKEKEESDAETIRRLQSSFRETPAQTVLELSRLDADLKKVREALDLEKSRAALAKKEAETEQARLNEALNTITASAGATSEAARRREEESREEIKRAISGKDREIALLTQSLTDANNAVQLAEAETNRLKSAKRSRVNDDEQREEELENERRKLRKVEMQLKHTKDDLDECQEERNRLKARVAIPIDVSAQTNDLLRNVESLNQAIVSKQARLRLDGGDVHANEILTWLSHMSEKIDVVAGLSRNQTRDFQMFEHVRSQALAKQLGEQAASFLPPPEQPRLHAEATGDMGIGLRLEKK